MAISWAYFRHILGISCACLGHILDKCWAFIGYILGISQHIVDISWLYLRHTVGIFCTYLGHSSAFAHDIPIICPRYGQDIPIICSRYGKDMPNICTRYAQMMANARYMPKMAKIYRSYGQDRLQINQLYVHDIQFKRLCTIIFFCNFQSKYLNLVVFNSTKYSFN